MGSLSHLRENALNAICPYFTMFPLEYPLRVLRKHAKTDTTVVDPFCGRGTTLFAARRLGIQAWGIDSSPVAVAIAQAKLARCSSSAVLSLAKELIEKHAHTTVPETEFFARAYHPETLREIVALRKGLLTRERSSNAAVLLRAAILGCLHGPVSKSKGAEAYLSNQMQRSFSPKPAYAVEYWKKHRLKARQISVVSVLHRKLERISTSCLVGANRYSQVVLADAQSTDAFGRLDKNFSVVITSPPYYGMRTYVQDQWLRHWFLGGKPAVEYGKHVRLDQSSQCAFAEALGRVWSNCATTDSDSLDMYIRFGVIPSSNVDARALLRESLGYSGLNWKLVSTRNAGTAYNGRRQATQMAGNSIPLTEFDFHIRRD